ncbi:hypothetical protein [Saccharopolyspora sp. ASAGF58]|uniref:hypothetical protein n=1 Tax=Saccharopolyspora sp. ASAGF58 TaxID=2719023 RepID=UPI0014400079|nr:hypothetical protein [Saccharopolyspora sp. ASAGF58]QIZ37266.1 hypothetical protein FDZ84_24905 [Saccharopolyspora sp. ASAGF58]
MTLPGLAGRVVRPTAVDLEAINTVLAVIRVAGPARTVGRHAACTERPHRLESEFTAAGARSGSVDAQACWLTT